MDAIGLTFEDANHLFILGYISIRTLGANTLGVDLCIGFSHLNPNIFAHGFWKNRMMVRNSDFQALLQIRNRTGVGRRTSSQVFLCRIALHHDQKQRLGPRRYRHHASHHRVMSSVGFPPKVARMTKRLNFSPTLVLQHAFWRACVGLHQRIDKMDQNLQWKHCQWISLLVCWTVLGSTMWSEGCRFTGSWH